MGLIKSAVSSLSGTLKDAWKDYFVCSLEPQALMKRIERRADSNNKGSSFVITHDSRISVPVGMAMVITNAGQVIEFTADAGEFVYKSDEPPTFFDAGGLFKGIKNIWKESTSRFQFAGSAPKNMSVYAINIKEVMGNKFGTPQPVPYEDPQYRNINLKYNGTYNFKIADVMTFIEVLAGTELRTSYKVEDFTLNMREMFMTYLNQEMNGLNLPYTRLTSAGIELTNRMVEALKNDWYDAYGILVTKVGINAPTLDEKSQQRVEKFGDAMFFQDSDVARGHMVGASADALKNAAGNAGGSMMGFMGLNQAEQAIGGVLNSQALNNQNKKTEQPIDVNKWQCSCGAQSEGKFCKECGTPKPVVNEWTCSCGKTNTGKFCSDCGNEKPVTNDWTCECGTINAGKFCKECGKSR